MEIPQKLKDHINESRAPLPPVSDPDEPLRIDSLGLIRLVSFMESDCGLRVEDEELVAENFATLRSLGELIATKSQNAETSRSGFSASDFSISDIPGTTALASLAKAATALFVPS